MYGSEKVKNNTYSQFFTFIEIKVPVCISAAIQFFYYILYQEEKYYTAYQD